MDPHVLIVEDDTELREVLVRGLRDEGFDRPGRRHRARAAGAAEGEPPDALIIDVGLPDSDGRDLCQALRAQGSRRRCCSSPRATRCPTGSSGFEAGGDDYVTKPFASRGDRAAAGAAAPRRDPTARVRWRSGPAARPGGARRAERRQRAELTPTEFRLLAALAARPGDAVRRHELVRAGWPPGRSCTTTRSTPTSPGCAASCAGSTMRRRSDGARRRLLDAMRARLRSASLRSRLLAAVLLSVAGALAVAVLAFNLILDDRLDQRRDHLLHDRASAELSTLRAVDGSLFAAESPDDAALDSQAWIFAGNRPSGAPAGPGPGRPRRRRPGGRSAPHDRRRHRRRLLAVPVGARGPTRRHGRGGRLAAALRAHRQHSRWSSSVVLAASSSSSARVVARWLDGRRYGRWPG